MYKFFFFFLVVNMHHKRSTKIFHLSVCNQKRFAKNLFSTNFAPPKAVAPQGHGLIGLRHKVRGPDSIYIAVTELLLKI